MSTCWYLSILLTLFAQRRGLLDKKYILSEVPDVFVKVFLLLVGADELIVCIVPEVERLWMSGSQALDHRDPTNLDLGACY